MQLNQKQGDVQRKINEVEYNLIQIKKSKLPSQVRSMIVIAYEAVTLPKK